MWEGYVFPPTGYYGHLKKLGYPFAISGDTKMTVSDIGCTRSALTVGAHTTKTSFTNISGTTLYYSGAVRGRIAPFSSVGPTGDYRIKPDITAPGFALASGVSSFDSSFNPTGDSYSSVVSADTLSGRTYRYAPFAGTSMAAPCASGIVAMLLQISPALTPDSVKVILNKTAITDAFTGVLPLPGTTTWGHGKINAYGAVKYLVQQLSVAGKNIDAMDCILYPNPASSSFTVAFTAQSNSDVSVTITDITGKIVSVENWQVTKGHNNRQFSIQSLRSGNYLVKVATTNGFVVNRLTVE
jgi:subtilisin family serine protease